MSARPRFPTRSRAAMLDMARAGAPAARLQGRLALRFPLGRRAGRGGPLSARGQHPARHDPAEPGARAGPAARHQLWRAGRAHRRRGAVSAAPVEQSIDAQAGASAARRARRRRRRRAASRPAPTASARRRVRSPSLLAHRRGGADRARNSVEDAGDASGRGGRPRRLHREAGRGQGHPPHERHAGLSDRVRPAEHGDAAGRPAARSASGCSGSAGSRTRASRGGCPTRW